MTRLLFTLALEGILLAAAFPLSAMRYLVVCVTLAGLALLLGAR